MELEVTLGSEDELASENAAVFLKGERKQHQVTESTPSFAKHEHSQSSQKWPFDDLIPMSLYAKLATGAQRIFHSLRCKPVSERYLFIDVETSLIFIKQDLVSKGTGEIIKFDLFPQSRPFRCF